MAVSGEALGRALGLSRAAVHKHVEQLRMLGFGVESAVGAGYRLTRPFTDLVCAEAALPFILQSSDSESAWTAGLPYHYLATCLSTNQVLKQLAASSPTGTVVVADEQTGGKGRLGRSWVSGPGKDLTFSVLLRPAVAPARAHLLSLAGALAVAEVLETHADLGRSVGIKWPNDVLIGEDKVCGILVEGSMDADSLVWAVAGIGLNVNSDPADLIAGLPPERAGEWEAKPKPASLWSALGREVERAPLLAGLLARLTKRWDSLGEEALLTGLRQRDVLAGCRVAVLSGQARDEPMMVGEATGIGSEGQLLVRSPSGQEQAVFAGDVTVRRATGS